MAVTFAAWPKKLIVGKGAIKELAGEIKNLGKGRVMLVTDKMLRELPLLATVENLLKDEGLEVFVYSDVIPTPIDTGVVNGVEMMKQCKPDIIVGLGGGSSIDTARAMNVLYNLGGTVRDYHVGDLKRQITPGLMPFVAIPTTSGTGSEVSTGAPIMDSETNEELIMDDILLIPDISVLDPEVTVSLPAFPTAYTGMDALTHLIEAYVSRIDFPVADGICLQGIKLVSNNLRTAVINGEDYEARENMAIAATMGCMAFNISQLGLVHGIALQLMTTGAKRLPHGLANAIVLPRVMRYNAGFRPDKFADIAEAFGVNISGLSPAEASNSSIKEVEHLMTDIGLPFYLDDVGVDRAIIPELVAKTMECPLIWDNPRDVKTEDVEKILNACFK
jgi:alcohol dehydrogenase